MFINKRELGHGKPVYLIAEIGSNHNQDKSRALDMINMAADAGADAVKFQSIRFDKLYREECESEEFRTWFRQVELDESWYYDLNDRAKRAGVDFISAPTYVNAIDLLEKCNVPAYKLASPQVQGNLDVVRRAAKTGKPLIMSLGYSKYADITDAIHIAKREGNDKIILLHCISKYPMWPEEANLNFIKTLGAMTGCLVGFSDHSLDDHVAIAAVTLGACIIEKHVTIDRNMPGPDHSFAMTFSEFGIMAHRIRDITAALGDGVRLELLDEEYEHRKYVERKLFSKRLIKSGERIASNSIEWLRFSGNGIVELERNFVDRCVARDDIAAGMPISWEQLDLT